MNLPRGFDSPAPIQLVRWMRDPFALLEEGQGRFGDAFTVRLPWLPTPLVVLADPEAVKDAFALGPDEADTGKVNEILKPVFGDRSSFLIDGAEHLRRRKMVLPAFHGERIHVYGKTTLELTHESVDRMPIGQKFSLLRTMQGITMRTMLRSVLGADESPGFDELAADLTRMLDAGTEPLRILGALFLLPLIQRDLVRSNALGRMIGLPIRAEAILRGEVRRAREQGTAGRTDVLAMLIDARDEMGGALGDDEIHDEVKTLLLAGYETTATALSWAMRWIVPDRSLTARLVDEIATADDDPARLAKLDLLDATVKESMRLQPAIPHVARVLRAPAKLGRTELPAGALVAPAIYLVHRRASLYPEPESFRPERFLGFKPAPWEWLPFGGGVRRCIGAAFATYQIKMALAAMLPRVEMELATRVRPVRRAVTMAPSGGLGVVVTARRPRRAESLR